MLLSETERILAYDEKNKDADLRSVIPDGLHRL